MINGIINYSQRLRHLTAGHTTRSGAAPTGWKGTDLHLHPGWQRSWDCKKNGV
jgi:hypothetical protein